MNHGGPHSSNWNQGAHYPSLRPVIDGRGHRRWWTKDTRSELLFRYPFTELSMDKIFQTRDQIPL